MAVLAVFVSQDYEFHSHGSEEWLLNDSDPDLFPRAPFRAMSDVPTQDIDFLIDKRFYASLEGEVINKAAAESRIQMICSVYDSFCDKIEYDDWYTIEQRYIFLLYPLKIVTEFDANILLEWVSSLGSHISKISFLNDPNRPRGQAWFHMMIISTPKIQSLKELLGVITHEIAHIVSLWILSNIDKSSPYNKDYLVFDEVIYRDNDLPIQIAKLSRENEKLSFNQDFVSGYSNEHNQEAFAELFNTWVNHHAPLIKLAIQDENIKKKYLLMRKAFGSRHLFLDLDTYNDLPLNTIPYDSTRFDGVMQPLHKH